jgi:hypothetical protein
MFAIVALFEGIRRKRYKKREGNILHLYRKEA